MILMPTFQLKLLIVSICVNGMTLNRHALIDVHCIYIYIFPSFLIILNVKPDQTIFAPHRGCVPGLS